MTNMSLACLYLLSTYILTWLPANQTILLSVCLPDGLPIWLTGCLLLCLSVYLPMSLSVGQSCRPDKVPLGIPQDCVLSCVKLSNTALRYKERWLGTFFWAHCTLLDKMHQLEILYYLDILLCNCPLIPVQEITALKNNNTIVPIKLLHALLIMVYRKFLYYDTCNCYYTNILQGELLTLPTIQLYSYIVFFIVHAVIQNTRRGL